jgi:predicted RNA-binding Zn-ribbon protein involved in translation (DUF1610 family)
MREDFDRRWQQLANEVIGGMKQWRLQHPRATLREIEEALDERLGEMRARMLEDTAQASEAAELNDEQGQRLKCPQCGAELEARGERSRRLQTHHRQQVEFTRGYGQCPQCGAGFFPPR